jgi:hypothetical protein
MGDAQSCPQYAKSGKRGLCSLQLIATPTAPPPSQRTPGLTDAPVSSTFTVNSVSVSDSIEIVT